MPTIKESARITGKANGTVGDLAQLAASTEKDSGEGMVWPIVTGQGLVDNCWLIHQIINSRIGLLPDTETMTLGQAMVRFRSRIPVEIRDEDMDATGRVARLSMRAAINEIWADLPLGMYTPDATEIDKRAYQVRKTLGAYLRDTLNAVCVLKPSQRRAMYTWWIREEWDSSPARQSTTKKAQKHVCPYPECNGRTFASLRALGIHKGHAHKEQEAATTLQILANPPAAAPPAPTNPSQPATRPVVQRVPVDEPSVAEWGTANKHPAISAVQTLVIENLQLTQRVQSLEDELAAEHDRRVKAERSLASMRELIQIARNIEQPPEG